MLREGQLIRDLKQGGINHDRVRECARNHISHGDLPATKAENHLKPTSEI
jgi:hypothetical protein